MPCNAPSSVTQNSDTIGVPGPPNMQARSTSGAYSIPMADLIMQVGPGAGQLEDPALPPQQLGVIVDDRGGELVTGHHAQLQLLLHHRIEHTFSLNVTTDIDRGPLAPEQPP